jgi:hypothetical protein
MASGGLSRLLSKFDTSSFSRCLLYQIILGCVNIPTLLINNNDGSWYVIANLQSYFSKHLFSLHHDDVGGHWTIVKISDALLVGKRIT